MFPVHTCRFICASDFFKDCPKAWDLFTNSEPNCSWGNNNRTLVNPGLIGETLQGVDWDTDEEEDQIAIMLDRCKTLIEQNMDGPWTYIDLEN